MKQKIAKLAFLMVLMVLTLQLSTPRPAAALTCQQQCDRNYAGCLHGCAHRCIGDDACYAACSAGCDADETACLSEC